jgi:hypothetical protein
VAGQQRTTSGLTPKGRTNPKDKKQMNADLLLSFLALAALGVLFYGPWQGICTDVARQVVFEQRDKLFDMAMTGRIAFDSKEYIEIRSGLEAIIRFSHDLTFPRAIYLAYMFPKIRERDNADPIISAIQRLDDAQLQTDIRRLVVRAYVTAMAMMVMKSSIGIIVVCLVAIPSIAVSALLKALANNIRAWLKTYVFEFGRVIQAEAECV